MIELTRSQPRAACYADLGVTFTPEEIRRYFSKFPALKPRGGELRGPCPVHEGNDDNFSVDPKTGRAFCHSQCGRGWDIIGLERELTGASFPEAKTAVYRQVGRSQDGNGIRINGSRPAAQTKPKLQPFKPASNGWHEVARYPYQDRAGKLLFEVTRCEPKTFRQRKPDGRGGWVWNLEGIERVPYRLPKLFQAETVYLVEGEKDVHTLEAWGLTASCNPGGSGSSHLYAEWLDYFRGKHIMVLPDNDEPGRKHAATVTQILLTAAASVRVVNLPGLPERGDVTDWKAAGGTLEQFRKLVSATEPMQKPVEPDEAGINTFSTSNTYPETETATPKATPSAVAEAALYGIAGDFARLLMPHTESSLEAVLVQFLAAAGVYLGRTGYYAVEGDKHHPNLFGCVVGGTSKGRKGTSWSQVRRLLQLADPAFGSGNLSSGLSSGEGLIWAVRDEMHEQQPVKEKGRVTGYQDVVTDSGIEDKRLLVVEPEFARALKAADRDCNTLSPVIRQSWDSGDLRVMTKSKSARATGAHIGIMAHITSDELSRLLTTTEAANGFANRFLWIHAERSKELPFGGSLTDADLLPVAGRLRQIRQHAETAGRIQFDAEAAADWVQVYGPLSSGKPGLLGSVIGRAEAQVVRLALLYALLDCDTAIRKAHLAAALAVWDYAENSARYIFGDALGDDTADTILGYLRSVGTAGATRTDISNLFGRNKSTSEIGRALKSLAGAGLAHSVREKQEHSAKPIETWFAGRRSA